MNDIERRLQSLEARVGRWRRATIGLAALALVSVTLGATRAQDALDVLRARRIEILGEDGSLAALLTGDGKGGGLIELRRGTESELVLALSAEDAGGVVRLGTGGAPGERKYGELGPTHWRAHGTADQVLWAVGEAQAGGGALRLADGDGATVVELSSVGEHTGRAAIATGSDGLSDLEAESDRTRDVLRVRALELVGEGDAVIGTLAKNDAGGGAFELRAKDGKAVVSIGQGPAGHGRVELRARTGGIAAEVGATALGEGSVTVFGRKERPLVRLFPKSEGQLPLGGGCVIFNYAGDEVVRLGVDTAGEGEVGVFDREGEGRVVVPR